MTFQLLPPSPALSDCDSLADIDDLEAFLAAQGPLSYFPTPDPKNELLYSRRYHTLEHHSPIAQEQDWSCHHSGQEIAWHTAEAFRRMTRECGNSLPGGTQDIARLLERASLPVELLALAFAVLDALSQKLVRMNCEEDLLLVAVLALADIHINDRPYSLRTWTRIITTRSIEVHYLDSMMLGILQHLDWSIRQLCDPTVIATYVFTISRHHVSRAQLPQLATSNGTTVLWRTGQLTPAEHSPNSIIKTRTTDFLRLL